MDLKEEDILGDRIADHWYYRTKAAAVQRLIGGTNYQRILDVGAGSGYFSKDFLLKTDVEEVYCIDTSYPSEWSDMVGGKPIHFLNSIKSSNADLVLLMDVLEHVDDDLGLLREYADKVPSGAKVLISVPAFSFLWSGHDIFLEHKRRYTLAQIEDVMRCAGLDIEKGCYFFGAIFPIVTTLRLFNKLGSNAEDSRSNLKEHSKLVNTMLTKLCTWELPLFRFNRAFGLSALCLARKP